MHFEGITYNTEKGFLKKAQNKKIANVASSV